MVVVVICTLCRGRRGQLHGLLEDIGQVDGARGHAVLAGAPLGGMSRTGEAISDGSGGAVEVIIGAGV